DAIIAVDEQHRIVIFNEGAEKIFGYSKAEAMGAPLDLLIPQRLRAAHRQHVERFATGPETARRMGERGLAIIGLRKNGEEFPADAAISKLEIGGTRILTVALRDVTAQKRVENEQRFLSDAGAILASTLDYEETLTSISQLAVREFADLCLVDVFDESGRIRRLRTVTRDPSLEWACEVLTRVSLDRTRPHLVHSALVRKRPILMERLSPDTVASFAQSEEHLRALRAIDPKSAIVVPLLAGGEVIGAIAFASSTPSRRYTLEDLQLAEALALRAALSIENARLYRAARRAIQARDDVLGIVAHDLRNPLHSILMQSELLRRHGKVSEHATQKPAETIRRSAMRMDRLIQDLLDVTRLEAGSLSVERARVPVQQVISESLEAHRPLAAAASLNLRSTLEHALPDVWADRDRLLQVFENLIGNAVKFSTPGAEITLSATPREGEVLFQVTDTGPGVAQEDLPHLFDRFWQARKTGRSGAGLGLPIAKGIIEAHGGRIWVESTQEQGTTVFFTIPEGTAGTRAATGGADSTLPQPFDPAAPLGE
ncbi:MAG: ATP-binding protein, partial [Myxococcota bacterium]